MKKLIIIVFAFLILCSCTDNIKWREYDNKGVRYVKTLIGTDTLDVSVAKDLVKQFNEEAMEETGIQLDASYIKFDFEKQQEIWPLCRMDLLCFADYTTIHYNWKGQGIAIFIREPSASDLLVRYLFGGLIAEIDSTKFQYIALRTTSYDVFKHEVYHVFTHGHSLLGNMFQFRSVMGIPIASSTLSDSTIEDILKNKWRKFY